MRGLAMSLRVRGGRISTITPTASQIAHVGTCSFDKFERRRLPHGGCGRADEPDHERHRKDATSPARAFRRRRELGLLVFERGIRHEEESWRVLKRSGKLDSAFYSCVTKRLKFHKGVSTRGDRLF